MTNRALNEIAPIQSQTTPLPTGDDLLDAIRARQFVVVYTLGGIRVINAPDFGSMPDDLIELRAFDEDGELHVVSSEKGLVGRLRSDGAGDEVEAFDEERLLWGRPAAGGEMITLKADRGTRIDLPADVVPEVKANERVTLRIRNYAKLNGQFAFDDWRMVGFSIRKGE